MGQVPKDSGWAWLVLVGATMQMCLVVGVIRTSGILFVAFQERFNSTSAMTSLISTVQNAVYSVSAFVVMTIGMKLTTCRNLAFIGSIILSIGYAVTSQATNIRVVLVSHGVIQGIGTSLMMPVTLTMVSQYFDKRRGFANCIAISGGSVGGLIYAPLITTLLAEYGYQGCVLIISGILMNGCVCAVLFRPLTFYTEAEKSPKKINGEIDHESAEVEGLIQVINSDDEINNILVSNRDHNKVNIPLTSNVNNDSSITNGNVNSLQVVQPKVLRNIIQGESQTRRIRCYSENQVETMKQTELDPSTVSKLDVKYKTKITSSSQVIGQERNGDTTARSRNIGQPISSATSKTLQGSRYMTGSMYDVSGILEIQKYDSESRQSLHSTSEPRNSRKINFLKVLSDTFDKNLLKLPMFIAFQCAASMLCSGILICTLFVAPRAKEMGISETDIAMLVTIYSSVDLCSRLVIAMVSDKGWVRRSTMVGWSAMVIAITAHLLRFYTSFEMLIAYSVVLGLVSGIYFSLFVVIIVDYLTLERLHSVLGFTCLCHGFSIAITFYIVGYLRDVTGSYVVPFHMLGTMTFLGGVLMFLFPFIHKLGSTESSSVLSVSADEHT